MDHLYRLLLGGETFHAVERDGTLRRATLRNDSVADGYTVGDIVPGGLKSAKILTPTRPSKIVCVGFNYRDHAAELKTALPSEPMIFLKPDNTVLNPGEAITLPPGVGRVEYEAELAVVIGRRAHRVKRANALDHIFGITCLNDVTAREIQRREIQYTRSKGFDTFCPFGPCIAVGAGAEARSVEGWVNGERRQHSTTQHLIFPVDYLIEYITFVMTLEPGDIVATGTPAGVGPLVAGDVFTVTIEGVGELTNPVVDE